jgi:ABC-type dipeptide/oligopeptide/nickel transport system ATPase component
MVAKDNDLFNDDDSQILTIFDAKYNKKESISKHDLFSGYKTLYGMTYSCDIGFLASILPYFEYAEIVLGSERVLGNEIINIFAVEKFTIEMLKPYLTKNEDIVYKMYYDKKLRLFVSQKLSHGKLFICEGDNNKNRVICGSSNMTVKGFSGQQNEINFKIDNDEKCISDFKTLFRSVSENVSEARPILEESVKYDKDEIKLDELPISTVVKTNKLFVLDVTKVVENKTEADMFYDINRQMVELEKYITPDDTHIEHGKKMITYDDLIRIKNRQVIVEEHEVKEGRKLNNLEIDFNNNEIYLNENSVLGKYNEEKVKEDIDILKEYFEGFEKYEFIGDIAQIKRNYYKLLNYMFISPFMCYFRNIYLKRGDTNKAEDGYQLFAILYGESGTGKSSVVRFILRMMFNKNNEVPKEYFTESNIRDLRLNYKGLPLYIDDLDKGRYDTHSDKIIKDATFGKVGNIENYPACVISLNKVGSISDYIKRRAVMIKVDGKHNSKYRLDGIADKLMKKISNNIYLKYLDIIFPKIQKLLYECIQDTNGEKRFDLYYESSNVLKELLNVKGFEFIPVLQHEDYFGDKELGRDAIKILIEKYRLNKRRFKIHKKINQVEFKNETSNEYGNRTLAEELPSYYKAKYDKYGIIINNYNLLKKDFLELGKIRI